MSQTEAQTETLTPNPDAGPSSAAGLSVGVAVDLEFDADAGGHVKCWERFAEAVAQSALPVDLTVYFLGPEERQMSLSDRVRYHLLPAVRGTRSLGLAQGAGHTDLARYHPGLAALLPRHDVLHATSVFALSRTMRHYAKRTATPYVASVHTDLPVFAAHYTGEVIGNKLNRTKAGRAATRVLVDGLQTPRLAAAWMTRKVRTILRPADAVLYSHEGQRRWMKQALTLTHPPTRLRRGIDKNLFAPRNRDRHWLYQHHGVPPDDVLLMFAGRLDQSKNILLAAQSVARLRSHYGQAVHFLAVGAGDQQPALQALLGAHVSLTGRVDQQILARFYASADLLLFPSTSETFGNVVQEAKACGLPAVVPQGTAQAQMIDHPGLDGLVLPSLRDQDWADALATLLMTPGQLGNMRAAVALAAKEVPSWGDVVEQDLYPVWHRVAKA